MRLPLVSSHRRAAVAVAAVTATGGLVAAGLAAAPASTAAGESMGIRPLYQTVTTKNVPTVGALFPHGVSGPHNCSGTVVASQGEPVVAVAAHCVAGKVKGWSFVPAYRNGTAPYGVWTVDAAFVDPRWDGGRGVGYDVAILRLQKKWINGANRSISYLTGSTTLGGPAPTGYIVDVTGYGKGRGGAPTSCSNVITKRNGYGYTSCSWLPSGVSGSGIRYGRDSTGHQYLGGVLGGFQQGGCAARDVYTSTFGPWVKELVRRANSGASGDTPPSAVGDGCSPARP